ncbi:MAG: NAD(P)/FAD-dependent oxidoreductase [Chloroflexi bacterium]|nr:NAD(P)/FAD-dependent oxidoreductase [Chloroflexota bacterium]
MAKMKDSYDAVVIGAGMAGLTCGALLAKRGQSVLVVERNARPGGYCSAFEHRGYTFDRGLRFLSGCELGGDIYRALEELGLRDHIDFVKMSPLIRVTGANYDFRIASVEALEDKLIEMFPAETPAIRQFAGECRRVAVDMQKLSGKSPDLIGLWRKIFLAVTFPFSYRGAAVYRRKPWRQVVEAYFRDTKLRSVILSLFSWFDPDVMAALPMMVLGAREDFYFPKGGGQALAGVLADGVQNYRGDLALDTAVERILVEDGRAVGVQLGDGSQVKARCIVSSVDAKQTFFRLVGEEHISRRFARKLNEARFSRSAFVVSLGVSLNLRAMGFDGANIVCNPSDDADELFGNDPAKCTVNINVHSILEQWRAPDSTTSVQLTALFPYDAVEDWTAAEETVADTLIATAENIIPRLSDHVISRHVMSPLSFEQITLNSQGAASGWYRAPRSKPRGQKTPIRNLYQAGQWVFPGDGVAATVTSGRYAAELVMREK